MRRAEINIQKENHSLVPDLSSTNRLRTQTNMQDYYTKRSNAASYG